MLDGGKIIAIISTRIPTDIIFAIPFGASFYPNALIIGLPKTS